MRTAILTSKSTPNLNLILELAKKLDIDSQLLTGEELEEIGLVRAIKKGKTRQYVDVDKFLKIGRAHV